MVMRPGQPDPNEFEIALLDRLGLENPDVKISTTDLHVLSREFTGVGSFTYFLIKGWAKTGKRRVIQTLAEVTIPGLEYGLGVVAFLEGDSLTLETFTSGEEKWDGIFDGFAIRPAK